MAIHSDLPIYRTGVQLLNLAVRAQVQMPRELKRQMGDKITQNCVDILELMALANAAQKQHRAEYLQALLTKQRAVTVMLRVVFDMRRLSPKLWAESVELLGSIGRQAGGWLKSADRKAPAA
ncbi:four helix bundle protein [Pseudacidovorax sp. RU35E]|uniref:four helix bundle protein n=1 Tax=Pseudacidovorax sp. RU35E TaxID=1907403 RepID=UPI000956DC64|nr:four helix bundle protein [Pseudacidovorax sp. RU35E]SIR00727.1 hypothetical protein SAMN05880557_107104 [Pseudacidovorax sp. RU35E]